MADFSFVGNDVHRMQWQASGQAPAATAATPTGGTAAAASAAAAARPVAIAIPSFREVQHAKKQRAVLPYLLRPGGSGGATPDGGAPSRYTGAARYALSCVPHLTSARSAPSCIVRFACVAGRRLQGCLVAAAPAIQPLGFHRWRGEPQRGPGGAASSPRAIVSPAAPVQAAAGLPSTATGEAACADGPRGLSIAEPPLQRATDGPAACSAVPSAAAVPTAAAAAAAAHGVPAAPAHPARCAVCSNVRWQYGDIVPDYLLGRETACLFLSLKWVLWCGCCWVLLLRGVGVGLGSGTALLLPLTRAHESVALASR